MDRQQLHQLSEYAGQFNLTLWVDRDKSWDDLDADGKQDDAGVSKSDTYKTAATAAEVKQDDAGLSKSDTYKTATTATVKQDDAGLSKSDTYKTATTDTAKPETQAAAITTDSPKQEAQVAATTTDTAKPTTQVAAAAAAAPAAAKATRVSLRLGALLYGNVLVLYSLKNRIGIVQDERQLLNSMLDKCGVNMQEYRFTKENILVYPPLIKNLEVVMSQDVNVIRNLVTGFLTALNDRSKAETGKDLYMLVVGGQDVLEHLPEHSKITPHAPIVVEGLRAMLDEPQKRKAAWEALKPFRDFMANDAASADAISADTMASDAASADAMVNDSSPANSMTH